MAQIIFDDTYIRTKLDEDSSSLLTSHFLSEVLPETAAFKRFKLAKLLELVDGDEGADFAKNMQLSKTENERTAEDYLIRRVMESLGHRMRAQVPLDTHSTADFCAFDTRYGEGKDVAGFAKDFTNTTCLVEAKKYGRIQKKRFIAKQSHDDEIYQVKDYLRLISDILEGHNSKHRVPFGVLTDGHLWRVYAKRYTYNDREFESHFVEFDLEAILACPDQQQRADLLKLFAYILSPKVICETMVSLESQSSELEVAVTDALKEQTFTSLEYIATGLWREIVSKQDPNLATTLKYTYGIDAAKAREDGRDRATLLKLVFDESVVYLLRLIFVLYTEDRNLMEGTGIPKVIKGHGNLLDAIVAKGQAIGEVGGSSDLNFRNDDLRMAQVFAAIDDRYNGGLFSRTRHPLLYNLNIDDELFANAIDNLCRVQVKKKVYTVDFSTTSSRELGSIYEGLLEYKLMVVGQDVTELPSIVNKKRIRHDIKAGDLVLVNHKGERQASGSYYTPDLIVEHLVTTSVWPKLKAIRDEHADSWDDLYAAVLKLHIVDPAMGSGHMLQAAFARIIEFLRRQNESMAEKGLPVPTWDDEFEYRVRTRVARGCIYGVDLNPMAVELAKLVMWIRLFRKDKAFEFFDYNLTCGNSLVGAYDEQLKIAPGQAGKQFSIVMSADEVEENAQKELLARVEQMMGMPRDTREMVHAVDEYWHSQVIPQQRQLAFLYNIRLSRWLLPDRWDKVAEAIDSLTIGIQREGLEYVGKVLDPEQLKNGGPELLRQVDVEIQSTYNPLHWKIAFPHVAVAGGFDVCLTNPPWDKVKSYREDYFSDYITGYGQMETKDAKAASNALMDADQAIKEGWQAYEASFATQNAFYSDSYRWQVVRDADGKQLKGDANLYKMFIEKVYTILADGGTCGIVVPDNLNIDAGCTGLRRLLLTKATIREMIMFENRLKLFQIDSRYKFDVLTFDKTPARANSVFDAGMYWFEPMWLDGEATPEEVAKKELRAKKNHGRYSYPMNLMREAFPDQMTILEFRNRRQIEVFRKLTALPGAGDESEFLALRTYREFDMTNDSDLFNMGGPGWPLMQGATVRHYNAHHAKPERFVIQSEGEQRLADKWRRDLKELPDRTYRIGWRDIAQPTDSRSLICTVLPRGSFVGNTLNLIEILIDGKPSRDNELTSGINAVLSSFIADFYVRQRMAKHVSAFILKALPLPRQTEVIRELGSMAMPLYQGDDFEAFRGDVVQLDDADKRDRLIARIDARVAHLYGLAYEDYQAVLDSFPLVEAGFKKRCLLAYNDWTFEL